MVLHYGGLFANVCYRIHLHNIVSNILQQRMILSYETLVYSQPFRNSDIDNSFSLFLNILDLRFRYPDFFRTIKEQDGPLRLVAFLTGNLDVILID